MDQLIFVDNVNVLVPSWLCFFPLSNPGGQGHGSWYLLRPENVAHGHAAGT